MRKPEVGPSWPRAAAGDGVLTEDSPALPAKKAVKYVALASFDAQPLADAAGYELELNWPTNTRGTVLLNGQELTGTVPGMVYNRIPAIPTALLKQGANELAVRAEATSDSARRQRGFSMRLRAVKASDLAYTITPIVGQVGDDFFTVCALTNLPTAMTLQIAGPDGKTIDKAGSKSEFSHQFRIEGLAPGVYKYTASASLASVDGATPVTAKGEVKVGPVGDKWRLVALGDSRSDPKAWRKVILAAGKQNPALIIHSGDLVANGADYDSWPRDFSSPASEVLASTPFYPVWGNHDGTGLMLDRIFSLPGVSDRWAQERGGLLMIGIDGTANWKPASPNYAWLEKTLAQSKAPYILLVTHYPPVSSSGHGKLAEDGLPAEQPMRVGRQTIMPLLERYGVQAIIAGHDHCYERSEVNGLITVIITGGAGAPAYGKASDAKVRNPYGQVFESTPHFTVFDVSPESVAMQALTPEGRVIDTRSWKPRDLSALPREVKPEVFTQPVTTSTPTTTQAAAH